MPTSPAASTQDYPVLVDRSGEDERIRCGQSDYIQGMFQHDKRLLSFLPHGGPTLKTTASIPSKAIAGDASARTSCTCRSTRAEMVQANSTTAPTQVSIVNPQNLNRPNPYPSEDYPRLSTHQDPDWLGQDPQFWVDEATKVKSTVPKGLNLVNRISEHVSSLLRMLRHDRLPACTCH